VDSKTFKKLKTSDEINNRCVEQCNGIKCEMRRKILNLLTALENQEAKDLYDKPDNGA